MRKISAVILLINSAWMTIYLYGEYANNSVKYHSSLTIFPIILFILALIIFFTSTSQVDKNTPENNEEKWVCFKGKYDTLTKSRIKLSCQG